MALLTDRYWRERFAARPDVIGTSVFLDGVPHTLVGVVSASAGRGIFVETDMWVPQELDAARASRDARTLFVSARLKPGVTPEQAERDLTAIAERLKKEYPATNAQTGIVVRPLVELLGGGIRFLLLAARAHRRLVVAHGLHQRLERRARTGFGATPRAFACEPCLAPAGGIM